MLTNFRKIEGNDSNGNATPGQEFKSMPNVADTSQAELDSNRNATFQSTPNLGESPKKATKNRRKSSRKCAPIYTQQGRGGVVLDIPNAAPDPTATELFTSRPDGRVKLRMGDGLSSKTPATVHSLMALTTQRAASRPAMAYKAEGTQKGFTFITYQEYYTLCCTAAKAFIKLGLERYHGVGILGFNSPEWFIADIGAIFAGGFATGIYTTNTPDACHYVAESCEANILVVENHQQLKKILEVRDRLPHLKAIVQYKGEVAVKDPDVYNWQQFLDIGKDVDDQELIERLTEQVPNQCCTLIYTSGTTGNPKGVMLSHDNVVSTSMIAMDIVRLNWCMEHFVSYLPLSHIAAQLLDLYIPMAIGGCVYFAEPDALKGSLVNTLREVRPTVFLGVPRVWEKMHEKMLEIGKTVTGVKRKLANWAKGLGLRAGMAKMNGQSTPLAFGLADSLILKKVRAALGLDRCQFAVTGAAPITKETLEYFMSLGIIVYELYGMSECSGPHTVNLPESFKVGSVGQTVEPNGTVTKLDNKDAEGNGEVCMSGRHVFMGYLNQTDKTEETVDADGFLHSGDVGRMMHGFLYITGRIKELIITAGGENIAPVPIEDAVKLALPCIANCMLVGDKKKFLSMLLTFKVEVEEVNAEPLDTLTSAALEWCRERGSQATTVKEILQRKEPAIYDAIQKGIDQANEASVSRAGRIAKWTILPTDFSVVGGELGPTLKLRRPIVSKMYKDTIDSLYAE